MSYSKITKLTLATVLGIGLLAGGTLTSAADHGATYDSKADINFKWNEGPGPGVVDPTDPTDPVDPTDPDVDPGTNGPLSIDYVSNFHFGEQTIVAGEATTYHAELTEIDGKDGLKEVANFLQVTDARANGAGWHLDVKQNGQFETENGQELAGATMTLQNSTLTSVSNSDAPTAEQEVVLDPEAGVVSVINAEEDQGMGTWSNSFGANAEQGAESVQLDLPANVKLSTEDQYKTTLTWELTDAPK